MELIVKHQTKIIVYVGVALVSVFIIAASYWYKSQYLKEVELTTGASVSVVGQQAENNNTISRETDTSTIDIEYPFVSSQFEGAVAANNSIKKIYSDRANTFEKEVQDSLSNNDLPQEFKNNGVSSYYDVSYEVVASTTRYISFVANGESFFVGSAHPSHTIDTFIFDIKNKRLIRTEELFVASSSYLKTLSTLTRADFGVRAAGGNAEGAVSDVEGSDGFVIDVSAQNDGFNPTVENFSRLLPTQDGLKIYFNEYQIAPYVAGPQESVIPYAALKKVIANDGVLGEYIK